MTKIQVDSNGKAIMLNGKALESNSGGSEPVITTLNITPSTTAQTITAPSGTDGYSPVNVSAVTSAIDQNISAGNIKSGVSILGVTGTYTGGGSKYGCTIESILGDIDASGELQQPSTDANLVFTGVRDVVAYGLAYRFYSDSRVTTIKMVSFPNLTNLTKLQSLRDAFYGCTGITSINLSSLKTVSGGSALQGTFQNCTGITSVDLSSLTTVSGSNAMQAAFSNCTGLTSVDLSSLTTVSGSSAMSGVFSNCTKLVTVDLSSLTTVSGGSAMNNAFYSCTSLVSVDFSSLERIGTNTSAINNSQFSQAFRNCTLLTSITFPELTAIYCNGSSYSQGTFYYCDKVNKFYFPKLTTITYGTGASTSNQNACKNIFANCSALTELHFAAANQAAIEASPGYSTAWGRGAGNVTIYFDL